MRAVVLIVGVIAIIALAFFKSAAPAYRKYPPPFVNTNALYMTCTTPGSSSWDWAAVCGGFVAAVAEVSAVNPIDGIIACVPSETRSSTLTAVVQSYLEGRSDLRRRLDLSGTREVALALAATYPCEELSADRRREVTYVSTEELQRRCASGGESRDAFCLGFIDGVIDMFEHGAVYGVSACFEEADMNTVHARVRGWLASPPLRWDQLSWPASRSVATALAAFRCLS